MCISFETAVLIAAKALKGHLTPIGIPSFVMALKVALTGKTEEERICGIMYVLWREKGSLLASLEADFLSDELETAQFLFCSPPHQLIYCLREADSPLAVRTLIRAMDVYEEEAMNALGQVMSSGALNAERLEYLCGLIAEYRALREKVLEL